MSAKVIIITARDNVATALEALAAGQTIDANGQQITVREPIASGHKIALAPIGSGENVVKYGNPIGIATADIAAGTHVHVHNVASTRGRGDQAVDLSAEARRAKVEGADTQGHRKHR
jgi:altronate hydrolase